ncbi:AAA family ATPase [Brucella pseudogrignonensis]|uniref:AAA family ATPase n=1 Tax=Brucella pseudogrignonensis TaxID=419475 RepID=UPI003D96837C
MRLAEFRVFGLFGLFDHIIPFNMDERITIIHAPNGFGKTVVLKLISAMFGGSLATFREVEYDRIEYVFDDDSVLRVTQSDHQPELFPDEVRKGHSRYNIRLVGTVEELVWDPDNNSVSRHRLGDIPLSMWERYLPFINRVGPGNWRDTNHGDVVGVQQLVERYGDQLPPSIRRRAPQPDWLENVRSSLSCRLIETQRLVSYEKRKGSYGSTEASMTLAVQTYSTELQASVERVLAESATLSQALDQTFPNRLLERMGDDSAILSEAVLRERLSSLEKQRARLASAGLLDSAKDGAIVSGSHFDDTTRKILSTYVEDTTSKLAIYDEILEKIELFLDVINNRFQFKSVSVDRVDGFVFHDIRKRRLEPKNLSSGEQHELVLIYDLLFKSKKNTLVLIDEPEISLHIAWQKRFLSDLRRIIDLTNIDAVVSTHSPQLIGPDIDLTVQLQPPADDILYSA